MLRSSSVNMAAEQLAGNRRCRRLDSSSCSIAVGVKHELLNSRIDELRP